MSQKATLLENVSVSIVVKQQIDTTWRLGTKFNYLQEITFNAGIFSGNTVLSFCSIIALATHVLVGNTVAFQEVQNHFSDYFPDDCWYESTETFITYASSTRDIYLKFKVVNLSLPEIE